MKQFWDKVNKNGPISSFRPDLGACWIWTSYITEKGYGRITLKNNKKVYVHRHVYELTNGLIPEELELDHLCRVRNCCNPNHLRLVTSKENSTAAGSQVFFNGKEHSAKTHCPQGHIYNQENTYIAIRKTTGKSYRLCRICHKENSKKYYYKKKGRTHVTFHKVRQS